MRLLLRPTFAALLAALAFACAGLGARAAAEAGGAPGPLLRRGGAETVVLDAQRTLALAFLRGGRPVLAGPSNRAGTLPGIARDAGASDPFPFPRPHAARRLHAGARIRLVLRPPFARRLAAARDGTLSARSTGVPPPALA